MNTFLFAVAGILAPMLALGADGVVAESGTGRVSLFELYTSEGCSSCPPAEERLGELMNAGGLWKNFVPVAFHVNYWDDLGWKDRLATDAYTERQREYAREANSTTVYTPEFVVDGREYRDDPAAAGVSEEKPGRLKVEQIGKRFRVTFFPEGDFAGGKASVALLGFDDASDIGAGENAGRRLVHQFVAMEMVSARLERDGKTGAWVATAAVSREIEGKMGIAAWVERDGSEAPVQAAGGWLGRF